jgi:hypothetical protein
MRFNILFHHISLLLIPALLLILTSWKAPATFAQSTQQEIETKARKVFELQKKNADAGKFSSNQDAAQYTDLLKTIAKGQSPEKARETTRLASLVTKYRAELDAFAKQGGLSLTTFKTSADLDARIASLAKAKSTFAELLSVSDPLPGLLMEKKVLENLLAQLNFYKKHWGKWEAGPNGPLLDLPQTEVDYLNELILGLKDLKQQQLNRLKNVAKENLEMLDDNKQ